MEEGKKKDIATEADVELLVNTFYTKVREDESLSAIFNPIIKDNWPVHLKRMCDFWSTLLLYTRTYKDDPLTKHLPLALEKAHFDKWMMLFNQTIDELFEGQIAENARKRASSIAKIMKAVKSIPE